VTGLVYLTGGPGVRAGFMLLYPIIVLAGSILLYRRSGLILAGVATAFYASLVSVVRLGLVPAEGLGDIRYMPINHLLYSIFIAAVACVTVAMTGSVLSESLRRTGERLAQANDEVADLRGLNEIIVRSIQSGLMTIDDQSRVLYLNPHGETILGRSRDEVHGQLASDVLMSNQLEPAALDLRVNDPRLGMFDLRYAHPDGAVMDLGLSVVRLMGASSSGSGFLIAFQDLTEVRRLAREVQLKEQLAIVGEMAAQLAHEIRNPLGSISGSAQVLMGEEEASPERRRLLAIITRESRRLSETLNRFLMEHRPSAVQSVPVDIGPLIAEAVALLKNGPEVGQSRRVEFEAEPGFYHCHADAGQISQMFWNLARNGLEAMPDGGVLTVRLRRTASEVFLTIRDEGRGMGGEDPGRLFVAFQTGKPMGIGLGLAIVYRIVRDHHGDISFQSHPARGTEVEVRLPLYQAPES
jgi:two-component system sensor histidine kinase PilS (NtrC family)